MVASFPGKGRILFLLGVSCILIVRCTAPQVTEGLITVGITADGKEIIVEVPAGSTVDNALNAGGIILESLDRTEPPLYTVLGDGSRVRVIRVQEEFIVEQDVIPFKSQVVQNESIPEGQEYWLQLGENGLKELTVRKVFEDGVEVSSSLVKSVVVKESVPQIKMVGVQKSFIPFEITGKLAYLVDGDAWIMEGTTAQRRQLVSSGDLDGRIFSLSPDGNWLLFTRLAEDEEAINTLWVIPLDEERGEEIDLGVSNVIHFADWKPGSELIIAYSTVEPRPGAPGWQANNDLQMLSFSQSGFVRELPEILESNSGGIYGWWGTTYEWSPDGKSLAYVQPDEIGTLDLETGTKTSLMEVVPVQTFGDWAWVPGIAWGPEGDILYSVDHVPPGESQEFSLDVNLLPQGEEYMIASEVGMFAYPVPSPLQAASSNENAHQVAYLQAVFPSQSESSRYRLMVMDRDGSNETVLFPHEGVEGLDPQVVVWSPGPLENSGSLCIALVYQNNLWIVDSATSESWQITGDGLTSRIDWK